MQMLSFLWCVRKCLLKGILCMCLNKQMRATPVTVTANLTCTVVGSMYIDDDSVDRCRKLYMGS